MSEPMITVNGEKLTIPQARRALRIPKHACFGCYLGDAGPDTHDECYLAEARSPSLPKGVSYG